MVSIIDWAGFGSYFGFEVRSLKTVAKGICLSISHFPFDLSILLLHP